MGQLEDIQVFLRVVESGGISRAAEQLNIAKSAVSRRLSDLEERLQTKLIQRTTRQFNLTDSGQNYYQQALQIIDSVESLNASVTDSCNGLEGKLKLSLPTSFGILHMVEAIDSFIKSHPKLALQVDLTDQTINLVESGIDVAFRIGELTDSSIQARKIVPIDFVICASPDYIKQHGEPSSLSDLKDMNFLRYGNTIGQAFELKNPEGQLETIHLKGSIQSNNGEILSDLAVKGHGLAIMPRFICWQQLEQGLLQELLVEYELPSLYGYAVYPQNRFLSAPAREFIDFLVEFFKKNRAWNKVVK